MWHGPAGPFGWADPTLPEVSCNQRTLQIKNMLYPTYSNCSIWHAIIKYLLMFKYISICWVTENVSKHPAVAMWQCRTSFLLSSLKSTSLCYTK